KCYHKENKKDQSVWVSSTGKFIYYIKESRTNKRSEWIIDKDGSKLIEYIIDPILKYIEMILNRQIINLNINQIKTSSIDIRRTTDEIQVCTKILSWIQTKKLAKDILE